MPDPPEETVIEDDGLNNAVIVFGPPDVDSETVPLKPLSEDIVTVDVPELPAVIVTDDGLVDIEKSGGGGAVTVTDTEVE